RTESPLAAASLPLVGGNGRALDIAAIGNCQRHVFVGNQIFDGKLDAFIDDLSPSLIAKIFLHFFEFGSDHAAQRSFITKDLLELRNQLDDLLVLVDDLLPLEGRQAA